MTSLSSIVSAILEISFRVLERIDKAKADKFRNRLADDAISVFLSQVKGDTTPKSASTKECSEVRPGRSTWYMDE